MASGSIRADERGEANVFMFRRELGMAAEALRAGHNVQVRSSHRGLGLTTVLGRLEQLLTAEGFTVVRFGGTVSAAPDYFSLQLAGFGSAVHRTPRPDGALVDEVAATLSASARTVVLIDGLQNIDPASTRILEAALERTGTRIVDGRDRDYWALRRSGVRWVPSAGFVLRLEPLGYIDIATLLQDALGAPSAPEVVSQVFAASGGVTGLALTLARSARTSGRITQRNGRWELDAPDLAAGDVKAWFEGTLATLTDTQIRALQDIALRTPVDDTQVVDELLGRGFLVRPANDPRRLVLAPPALSNYFRNRAGAGAMPLPDEAPPVREGAAPTASAMDMARTVRAYSERSEKLMLERRRVWLDDPRPATALPYLMSLAGSPRTERAIHDVYENTSITEATSSTEAFDFAVFAMLRQDKDGKALSAPAVQKVLSLFPEWAPVLRTLQTYSQTGQVPATDVAAARAMPATDDRAAMVLALDAYAQLGTGRVRRVQSALRRARSSSVTARRFQRFVEPLVPLVRGDALGSPEIARRALRQAIEDADYHEVLLQSYVCIAISLWRRDFADAVRHVDQALAFGAPGGSTAAVYRGILLLGSFTHALLGVRSTAQDFAAEAALIDVPMPPLPGMHPRLGLVVAALTQGRSDEAVTIARDAAADMLAAGQRYPAIVTLKYALSLHPDRETLAMLRQARTFEHGHALRTPAWVAVVEATFASAEAFAEAIRRLGPEGCSPLLLAALAHRRAETASSAPAVSDAIAVYLDDVARRGGPAALLAGGARGESAVLTERERQIGLLAAGASNKEIAQQLSISVRTVESHIRGAMRKMNVRDRAELTRTISLAPLTA